MDGRLERYTRPHNTKIVVSRVFPSQVGFIKNLYASPNEQGFDVHWLENRFFQRIDDLAACVFEKLNAADPNELTAEETSSWSVFIYALFHRTPDALKAYKASGYSMWQKTVSEIRDRYSEFKGSYDPETYADYIAAHRYEDVERQVLNILPGIMMSERVGQFLNDMHWQIIDCTNSEQTLLISDNPIARTNGLMKEGGHLALPLSPRRLLIMAHERAVFHTFDAMSVLELVKAMNRWTVEGAQHFVGSIDRSQDRFIRNRFGTDPKPALSQRGPEHSTLRIPFTA